MIAIRLARPLASLLLLALTAAPARAQVEPVRVTTVTQVPAGKKPTLTIKALMRVNNAVLELTRDGDENPTPTTLRIGSLNAGQSRTIPVGDGAIGSASYSGTLSLTWGAGEAWSGGISMATVVNAEIRIGYQREHLFLDKHVLEFQISRPSAQLEADLTVYGDQGQVIGDGKQSFTKVSPGKWISISWLPTEESAVMMMKLHVSDPGGFVDQTLTPWQVSIPHEEVNFASNSSMIEASEGPKLDAAYGAIMAEVEKAQKLGVRCSLFIAGHTDTVGPRDKNQRLSLDRARSIATWFRKRGLTLKVSYEGFGEERPKVATPDETDERANRRADYTLSAEGPPSAGTTFKWKEVK